MLSGPIPEFTSRSASGARRMSALRSSSLNALVVIEVDHADILEREYPSWMGDVFPHDVREQGGRLTPVSAMTMREHLERLALVRGHLRGELVALDDADYRRVRSVQSGRTTPEWVLHHLRQHEAEHRGQIQAARRAIELTG